MASQSISFRPAEVIRRIPWSLDKKAALGLVLILITFSLVGWLYLGQASVITSSTLRIERMQQGIALVNQQNADLSLQIAELESLTRIEVRARELGYAPTDPANLRYLPVNNFPAPETEDDISRIARTPNPRETVWQLWLDSFVAWVLGRPVPE
jgi:cell division protein FtsL